MLFFQICELIVNFTDADDFNVAINFIFVIWVVILDPYYAVKIVLRGYSEQFLIFVVDPSNSRKNHVDCFIFWKIEPF